MNTLDFVRPADFIVELGQTRCRALAGDQVLELPIERSANGQLTASCREQLIAQLRTLTSRRSRWGRPRVLCAVGARGVSLRRAQLPASARENALRLLALQMEKDLPLSPDELAWGYYPIASANNPGRAGGPIELVLVALKKELVEDYQAILGPLNLEPVLTLGILAATSLCPEPAGDYALLEIGRTQSELLTVEQGVPVNVRSLPWGGDDLTRSIAAAAGVNETMAEEMKSGGAKETMGSGLLQKAVADALNTEVQTLARQIKGSWRGQTIYVGGANARIPGFTAALGSALGAVDCRPLESVARNGISSGMFALQRHWGRDGLCPPLVLSTGHTMVGAPPERSRASIKWAAIATVLALGCLALRYVEPALRKNQLNQRLAEIHAAQAALPEIDSELGFLQHVESNQPPFLEVVGAISDAAARGTQLESLSLTRRGELSLRGSMPGSQQATDFRSKLIKSGWFSSVAVDEQAPVQNQPKVTVRMSGRWNTLKKAGPPPASSGTATTNNAHRNVTAPVPSPKSP